jgi:hypothetical protein
MVKQKKKAPGRPKKEFISQKPKTKIKAWPGRPRKDKKDRIAPIKNSTSPKKISPEIKTFVSQSVDDSKKKDLIILMLFVFSFILFVVSLYYTFMREDVSKVSQEELAQITNIDKGNIDYNVPDSEDETEVKIIIETPDTQERMEPIQHIQWLTPEQQTIIDFYHALNTIDIESLYIITDARLKETNVFRTYYSRNRLTKFADTILAPKIVVTNIQEKETTTTNPDIRHFEYTLEYILANTQQKFTEERSTTLIKRGEERKIGKLMCETKGCSTMPFFNTEKYK